MATDNDLVSDIRGIVQYDKTRADLNKLLKEVTALQKTAIESKKIVTGQDGSSSSATNATDQEGNTPTGDTTVFPPAPPQNPNPNNNNNQNGQTQNPTDTGNNSSGSGNTTAPENSNESSGNTNPSGAGTNPPPQGEDLEEQVSEGQTGGGMLQELYDSLIAQGISPEVAQSLVNQVAVTSPGYHPISAVANGTSGPTIGSTQTLQGVVGSDPVTGNPMVVSFTPYMESVIPPGWESPNYGPVIEGYEQGYYWFGSYGGDVYYSTPNVSAYSEQVTTTLNEGPDGELGYYEWAGLYTDTSTQKVLKFKFTYHDESGSIDDLPIGTLDRFACGGGDYDTSYCPLEPPRETVWPILDKFWLWFSNGVVKYMQQNVKDIPDRFKVPTSNVVMQAADGSQYNVEVAVNGGYMISKADGTGVALYYNSQGQLTTLVQPSQIKYYLPRIL